MATFWTARQDGFIHEADGTKVNPEDGKVVEDDGDQVGQDGKKLPKRDDFAAEAAKNNKKRKADKAAKKLAEHRRRMARLNPFDGLIHEDNGVRIDPNDDQIVAPCQCYWK